MGRGCRGQTPPRCSRVAAAHQEPSCSATGRCGRTPSSHHSRSGLFGDTKRSLSGMWPGWGRPSFEGHPCLPCLSLASSSKKEGDGTRQAVATRTLPLLGATPRPGSGSPRRGMWWRHPRLGWRGEVGLPPLIPPRRSSRVGGKDQLQISESCSPHLQGEGGRW